MHVRRKSRLVRYRRYTIRSRSGLTVVLALALLGGVVSVCGGAARALTPAVTVDGTLASASPSLDSPAPANPGPPLDGSPPVAMEVVDAPAALPLAAESTHPAPLVEPNSDVVFDEFFVHVPPVIDGRVQVLVVLHGMEGNGPAFARPLRARTDREGWLVVAPTYLYGNWQDPTQVVREETAGFLPRLHAFLAELPARTGLDLAPRVVVYGASRGGQLAERFAMVYPEQTYGVAAMAGGTWTLPLNTTEVDGHRVPLPYPFGAADLRERFGHDLDVAALRRIPFWVGVGGEDRDPAAVPRQWDPYLGSTRVERARTIVRRLADLGATVEFTLFPGAGHTLTDEMQARALDFLAVLPAQPAQ
jgi:poly(3-hydroxybutyrate) depolymerase